jgi:hypothetical protein
MYEMIEVAGNIASVLATILSIAGAIVWRRHRRRGHGGLGARPTGAPEPAEDVEPEVELASQAHGGSATAEGCDGRAKAADERVG